MMNTTDKSQLETAIRFSNSGKPLMVYQLLSELAQRNDNNKNPDVLLWIAFTTPDKNEAEKAILMIEKIDPANPQLANAKNWLATQKAKAKAPDPFISPLQQPQPLYSQPPPQKWPGWLKATAWVMFILAFCLTAYIILILLGQL